MSPWFVSSHVSPRRVQRDVRRKQPLTNACNCAIASKDLPTHTSSALTRQYGPYRASSAEGKIRVWQQGQKDPTFSCCSKLKPTQSRAPVAVRRLSSFQKVLVRFTPRGTFEELICTEYFSYCIPTLDITGVHLILPLHHILLPQEWRTLPMVRVVANFPNRPQGMLANNCFPNRRSPQGSDCPRCAPAQGALRRGREASRDCALGAPTLRLGADSQRRLFAAGR